MSPDMTIAELHQKLSTNIDLYNYICALDLYIDDLMLHVEKLEEKNKVEEFFTANSNPQPNVVLMYGHDFPKLKGKKSKRSLD